MKAAIMQPYLCPYVGYFQLMSAVDTFVIYDDVAFINKGWINRNKILLAGNEFRFTLPLKNASQNKLIKDISIVPEEKERLKILSLFRHAYARAPYFNTAQPLLDKIFLYPSCNLVEFITNSFCIIGEYLHITSAFMYSSQLGQDNFVKGQDKIIDICIRLHANEYINPIGGQELYSKRQFENKNIKLFFLKSKPIIYEQYNAPCIPNLSIIDVLMFQSRNDARKLLHEYELI